MFSFGISSPTTPRPLRRLTRSTPRPLPVSARNASKRLPWQDERYPGLGTTASHRHVPEPLGRVQEPTRLCQQRCTDSTWPPHPASFKMITCQNGEGALRNLGYDMSKPSCMKTMWKSLFVSLSLFSTPPFRVDELHTHMLLAEKTRARAGGLRGAAHARVPAGALEGPGLRAADVILLLIMILLVLLLSLLIPTLD